MRHRPTCLNRRSYSLVSVAKKLLTRRAAVSGRPESDWHLIEECPECTYSHIVEVTK